MNVGRMAIVAVAAGFLGSFGPMAQPRSHDHGSSGGRPVAWSPEAAEFLADNERAMSRMMAAMHVEPSGDVDRDFVAMMVPHHQGAIDMARAALRSSRNARIRRLAQEIIVTQLEEINAMRLALEAGGSGGGVLPSQPAARAAATTRSVDRVYTADQYSNTVSVIDPSSNELLGVIKMGDTQSASLSPLYRGQLLVHGLGFSPDGKTLAVVSIGSNSVSFIDTASNTVKATTYLGRSPHEASFTPDGRQLWVTVRGEDYVSVIDPGTHRERARIAVPPGPGMAIFSPDGRYGYVCSSFTAEVVAIAVATQRIVGRMKQDSPFCPNLAVTPDGRQLWLTLKDIGRVMVFDGRPPFALLHRIDTGPLTNHVNFARSSARTLAYVTIGGTNEIRVFDTDTFEPETSIAVDGLPHGLWPSARGDRLYVGLENADRVAVIDTEKSVVVARIPVGQAPQAVVYVPGVASPGDGRAGLLPLGDASRITSLVLAPVDKATAGQSSVALFDEGLTQVLQAAVAGLAPRRPYVLALAARADGGGVLEPLASFSTNPAGAAVVNAIGPIRQIMRDATVSHRRYLVIAPGTTADHGPPVQVQAPDS